MNTFPRRNATVRSRVVEAAVQLFSRQGYHGTSTREIARLADVNENTLFRHFARKEDLFWAAIQSRLVEVTVKKELQTAIADGSAPEVVIPRIMELFVNLARYHPEMVRLLAIAFLELSPKAGHYCREFLSPVVATILEYVTKCLRANMASDLDPTIVVAALAATVVAHNTVFELLDGTAPQFSNNQEAIAAYSNLWLTVLAPKVDGRPLSAPALRGVN